MISKENFMITNKLKIDIVFGGLGIELLPDISDVIKKTFIKYRELDQLV